MSESIPEEIYFSKTNSKYDFTFFYVFCFVLFKAN